MSLVLSYPTSKQELFNKTQPKQGATLFSGLTQLSLPTSFSCTVSILEARRTNNRCAASLAARSGHVTLPANETKQEMGWGFLGRLLLFLIKVTGASGVAPSH